MRFSLLHYPKRNGDGRMIGAAIAGCIALAGIFTILHFQADGTKGPHKLPKGPRTNTSSFSISSIYSTSTQKKLKFVHTFLNKGGREDLDRLYRESQGMGASNVFLVRGKDINEAVKATSHVFTGSMPADVPVSPFQRTTPNKLWLVGYLGVQGSEPPAWIVRSVKREKNTFQVANSKASSITDDVHQYFVWVPIGELKPGEYTLHLLDATQGEATLLRRVVVPAQ